jgi:putative phosphoesterase
MEIGVISDTHGIIHPGVLELFEGVDAIFHAGDIGTDHVLSALKKIAPVMAVRGNMDSPPFSYDIPAYRISRVGEMDILITHRVGNPMHPSTELKERLLQVRPAAVVFGHTHHPFEEWVDGVLFFNPGSAGQVRHGHPLTVGFLDVNEEKVSGRIVYLNHK